MTRQLAGCLRRERTVMHPTHYCIKCGALWRQCDDGSWNLRSEKAGPCCDNAPMGKQIRPLTEVHAAIAQLHGFVKHIANWRCSAEDGDTVIVWKDEATSLLEASRHAAQLATNNGD